MFDIILNPERFAYSRIPDAPGGDPELNAYPVATRTVLRAILATLQNDSVSGAVGVHDVVRVLRAEPTPSALAEYLQGTEAAHLIDPSASRERAFGVYCFLHAAMAADCRKVLGMPAQ